MNVKAKLTIFAVVAILATAVVLHAATINRGSSDILQGAGPYQLNVNQPEGAIVVLDGHVLVPTTQYSIFGNTLTLNTWNLAQQPTSTSTLQVIYR